MLTRLRDRIVYNYHPTPGGGRVDIRTTDPEALEALHAFLRFQITDHRRAIPSRSNPGDTTEDSLPTLNDVHEVDVRLTIACLLLVERLEVGRCCGSSNSVVLITDGNPTFTIGSRRDLLALLAQWRAELLPKLSQPKAR